MVSRIQAYNQYKALCAKYELILLKTWNHKGSTAMFFQTRCEIIKTEQAALARAAELFSDSESDSDYSEYDSDPEPAVPTNAQLRDWEGNIVEFNGDSPFYPISASKFSRNILKQYKNNRRVALEKTGYQLPLTFANIKKQRGRIHRNASTIMDKKGKIVFP